MTHVTLIRVIRSQTFKNKKHLQYKTKFLIVWPSPGPSLKSFLSTRLISLFNTKIPPQSVLFSFLSSSLELFTQCIMFGCYLTETRYSDIYFIVRLYPQMTFPHSCLIVSSSSFPHLYSYSIYNLLYLYISLCSNPYVNNSFMLMPWCSYNIVFLMCWLFLNRPCPPICAITYIHYHHLLFFFSILLFFLSFFSLFFFNEILLLFSFFSLLFLFLASLLIQWHFPSHIS